MMNTSNQISLDINDDADRLIRADVLYPASQRGTIDAPSRLSEIYYATIEIHTKADMTIIDVQYKS
jgi:hypothetical protein